MSDSNEQLTPLTLESQLAAEQAALRNAPKIEIVVGSVRRCYFCGQVTSGAEVHSTVPTQYGELTIHKCGSCKSE